MLRQICPATPANIASVLLARRVLRLANLAREEYCTFCSTTSYAASFERKLCLECKKDENAAFMGDAMDLELD